MVMVFLFGFEEDSIKDKDKLKTRGFIKEEEEKERKREGSELLGLIKDSSANNNYKEGPSVIAKANTPLADSARIMYNYIFTNRSK